MGDDQGNVSKGVAAYHNTQNRLPHMHAFSADEVEHVHRTALRILQELGIRVLLPEAREIFARAGARLDDEMVYLDAAIVEAVVAYAPKAFTLHGRAPHRDRTVDAKTVHFGAGAGCPNITDLERGRRPGSLEAFRETTRLQQSFDIISKLTPSAEPQDIPVNLRHLDTMEIQLTDSDKCPWIYSRGRAQVEDAFRCVAATKGLDEETFHEAAHCFTVINTNSPRQLDIPMSQGIIDFARWGQPSVITPFCLAGAMAPITVAGALALSHAEAMAGIALAQLVRPGAPVIYGAFSSNVDMKSGAPVFGTPEHMKANFGAGQLARHLGIPWRSAAGTAANLADSQAANETQLALWGTLLGGANFIYHAAGWLEGGLTFSMEKFICDLEVLQTVALAMQPVSASDDEIGFDSLAQVQPGGHFFDAPQTMERYKTAFYEPLLSDWSNFGQWTDAGAVPSEARATGIWKQKLAEFEPPPIEPDHKAALQDFIARRKAEGGADLLD
ncbi:MAG: trimethylamine methyltransferase family protein [Pseudomonadota bacterium]